MAVQYPCEVCGESYPETTMLAIALTGKIMCPVCIDQLIVDLARELPDAHLKGILEDF